MRELTLSSLLMLCFFWKKPVSRSASSGTDYFHWSSHGMITEIKAPRHSFLKNALNTYSYITD